jgi:hypothetical protein
MSADDRASLYPHCMATLAQLLTTTTATAAATAAATTATFRVGPGVLRAPAPLARRAPVADGHDPVADGRGDDDGDGRSDTGALLGELTDMMLVGADDADSGRPEIHLQFKSDVVGGLQLRLVKKPEGLSAVFIVKDAATRRAVVGHVDALVARLRERGFTVVEARLEVG